jgi:hypothetical protein
MAAKLGDFPPPPAKQTLMLPGGASLTGMASLPRGVGEDCTVTFNLMLQLGVALGSLECLLRLFKFVGGLIQVVQEASKTPPDPVSVVKKLAELAPAAEELAECVVAFSPIGICPPVKDALKLIRSYLACLVELLDSVASQKLDIGVKMKDAQSAGNEQLLDVLQQAQNNADLMGGQALASCEPIFDLLKIVGGLVEFVGVGGVAFPSLDELTGGQLETALQPLKDFLVVLDEVIGLLPC